MRPSPLTPQIEGDSFRVSAWKAGCRLVDRRATNKFEGRSRRDREQGQIRSNSKLLFSQISRMVLHRSFLGGCAYTLLIGVILSHQVAASSRRLQAPGVKNPEGQYPVAMKIQTEEGNALLELRKALLDHPVFDGFTPEQQRDIPELNNLPYGKWTMSENLEGMPGFSRTPCSYAGWAWVGCDATARVVYINLDGLELGKLNDTWKSEAANPIKGTIPWNALTVLKNLNTFKIGHQLISGTLEGIGGLSAMRNLTMTDNQLTGPIPDELSKLTALVDFRVEQNKLSGVLPQSISTMTNLAALAVCCNSLGGPFPEWLGNLAGLQWLDFSTNAFMGTLPESWSKLTKLTGFQLQFTSVNGSVPSAWSAMKSLKHIGLKSTNLQSTFPDFITNLPRVRDVRLSENRLYGPLPSNLFKYTMHEVSLEDNYFNGTAETYPEGLNDNFKPNLDMNCFSKLANDKKGYQPRAREECTKFYTELYTPPGAAEAALQAAAAEATKKSNTTIIIVSVVVVVVVAAALAVLGYVFWKSRRRTRISKLFTKGLRQTSREFTLPELKKATQNWQTVIGKGGYGTVFKAELSDGSFVAVKRLDQVSKQGDVEFIREVELLSRVHHRHLVNLVGFCAEKGERALVYEYMAMGSLYEHLHGESAKQYPLSWDSRCKIAIHVALGIEYLHYGADPPLIHRDIKSANILLSDDGYSKVADFGLCKEAPVGAAADGSEQLVPTATAVRGSFGYLDPEYVNTSILSEKSDVYSYGVVLLELISGHKSIHDWQPLAYWAEEYLADREKTPLMVDPALEGNFDLDELYALCDIARTCVQDQSANRPTIRDVAKALVENLGHGMSSFMGSQQDSASIVPSSQSDASSMPSTTYTPSSAEASNEFTYQNYSETLHWTPNASGDMSSKNGGGLTVSTGAKGDRLPVPVPKRPDDRKDDPEKGPL